MALHADIYQQKVKTELRCTYKTNTNSLQREDLGLRIIFVRVYPRTDLIQLSERRPRHTARQPHFQNLWGPEY